jgi:bifunctional non-homologous end joining protein LigD
VPLGERKAKLLAPARAGIAFNEHTDASGGLFRQACAMGLEGIVSKRLTAPYRSGTGSKSRTRTAGYGAAPERRVVGSIRADDQPQP